MAYEAFIERNFSDDSLETIKKADAICREYMKQGFKLTLRQLYYQFVARGLLENKSTNYDKLGSIISKARLAGLLDWDAIEDRTRNLEKLASWDSPRDIISACAQQFRFDMWEKQRTRVEVWIEKEALVGVIERVCNKWRVPYFACRGYTSQSEQYGAAKRFQEYHEADQDVVILHLGDHDPSGLDMTRDNLDRLSMFCSKYDTWAPEVRRLALNIDQVRKYNPPPNPAKATDARFEGYKIKFGETSWELDALSPQMIAELIGDNIVGEIEMDQWREDEAREKTARARIAEIADKWKD